jgi:hypothetical protein
MRRLLILLALVLAACGDNGDGLTIALEPVQHVPEISNLTLSPDSALYMEGNGSVQVTAALSYTDLGQDLETLHVIISDGTSLAVPISGAAGRVSDTLTVTFDVTTADANGCTVEIWLVDEAEQSSNHLSAAFSVIRHAPEILNVSLSPDSASNMQGDGSVAVSAEISFHDVGLDIQTLWVRMPDDSIIKFAESISTETGSFSEDLTMSTQTVGTVVLEFWLSDQAGDDSVPVTAEFQVLADMQSSDWTNRLTVPLPLLDVVWDGQVFIAVGYGGTILTSVNGIDWVTQESSSDDNIWDDALYAVATFGSDIYAVGGSGVLLSTDHGETWTVIGKPDFFIGTAVAANSSRIVALGTVPDLGIPLITVSEDSGNTWETWDVSWSTGDLIYRDGLFVTPSGPGVRVSTDGKQWNEIVVDDVNTALNEVIVHDDSQFFVVGSDGTVFSSFDASNWTEVSKPLADVDYMGAAWSGTQLMLAGRVSWNLQDGTYRPIGISSSDGGASWDIFGIDTNFESYGIAWGNGRFVSVGRSALSDEGAIYTTD